MKQYEIHAEEYMITPIELDTSIIAYELGEDIAFSMFSPFLTKAAMCRNVQLTNVAKIFKEFIGEAKLRPHDYPRLIKIKLTGGNAMKKSQSYVQDLLVELMKIDNDTDAIDIIAFDVCSREHPNSISFSCATGDMKPAKKLKLNL